MKLTNTQWIIAIAVLAVAIWYFFFKDKKSDESGYKKACPAGWKCPGAYCDGNWVKTTSGEVACKRGSRAGMITNS